MKNARKCPKCNNSVIARFPEGAIGETKQSVRLRRIHDRLQARSLHSSGSETASAVEAARVNLIEAQESARYYRYVCASCGYCELYLEDPRLLLDEEIAKLRAVEWEEAAPAVGPFR